MENLFLKNPLQDLLSSLNAVISTNESSQIITGHVIYNPAYTYKFQLKTTDHLKTWKPILQKTAARSRTFVDNNGGHNDGGLWLGTDNYRVNILSLQSKRLKIKRMFFDKWAKDGQSFLKVRLTLVKTGCSDINWPFSRKHEIACSPSD